MIQNEEIKDWLNLCGVDSIDKLTVEQCCILYDNLYPQSEAVTFCYKDSKNAEERVKLGRDVRKCLTSESRITVFKLTNEGVIFDEEDDKYFQHKYDYIIE